MKFAKTTKKFKTDTAIRNQETPSRTNGIGGVISLISLVYTIENGMILSPIVRQNSNVGKMFNSISVSSNNIPPSPNMSNRTNGIAQNVVNA